MQYLEADKAIPYRVTYLINNSITEDSIIGDYLLLSSRFDSG